MKVKIIKNKKLDERTISQSKLNRGAQETSLKKFFNPDGKEYFFNKRLIFYDLETKGLLPAPYIHQFAALAYDPPANGGIPNPETPDDAYVAKCFFTPNQFGREDGKIIGRRWSFYNRLRQEPNEEGKRPTKPIVNETYPKLREALYQKHFRNYRKKPSVINVKDQNQLKGMFLFAYEFDKNKTNTDQEFILKLKNFLSATKKKHGEEVYEVDNFRKYEAFNWPSKKTLEKFAAIQIARIGEEVWTLITRLIDNYPVRHHEKQYDYKNKVKPLLALYKYIKKDVFNLTYKENYALTHVDQFPLPQFKDKLPKQGRKEFQFDVAETFGKEIGKRAKQVNQVKPGPNKEPYEIDLVSEKKALTGFLEFLKAQKEDYILVGQNITTFDNQVILAAAERHKIPKDLVDNFYESYVYDTLPFFRHMITLFSYYEQEFAKFYATLGASNDQMIDLFRDSLTDDGLSDLEVYRSKVLAADKEPTEKRLKMQKETEKYFKIVNGLMDKLRVKYPNPKQKLDGLLYMFKDPAAAAVEQTHAADDDCVQLARVFLENYNQVKDIMDHYHRLFTEISAIKIEYHKIRDSIFGDNRPTQTYKKQAYTQGRDYLFHASKTQQFAYVARKMAEDVIYVRGMQLGANKADLTPQLQANDIKTLDQREIDGKTYQEEIKQRARDFTRLVCIQILKDLKGEVTLPQILFMQSKDIIKNYWDEHYDTAIENIKNDNSRKGNFASKLNNILNWDYRSISQKKAAAYSKKNMIEAAEGKTKLIKVKII